MDACPAEVVLGQGTSAGPTARSSWAWTTVTYAPNRWTRFRMPPCQPNTRVHTRSCAVGLQVGRAGGEARPPIWPRTSNPRRARHKECRAATARHRRGGAGHWSVHGRRRGNARSAATVGGPCQPRGPRVGGGVVCSWDDIGPRAGDAVGQRRGRAGRRRGGCAAGRARITRPGVPAWYVGSDARPRAGSWPDQPQAGTWAEGHARQLRAPVGASAPRGEQPRHRHARCGGAPLAHTTDAAAAPPPPPLRWANAGRPDGSRCTSGDDPQQRPRSARSFAINIK